MTQTGVKFETTITNAIKKITLIVNPIIIDLTGPYLSKIHLERGIKTQRNKLSQPLLWHASHARGQTSQAKIATSLHINKGLVN